MFRKFFPLLFILSALAVFSASLAACSRQVTPVPTPIPPDYDAEEQAVYAALIAAMYPAPMVVIMDTTATDPVGVEGLAQTLQYVQQNMSALSQETADSFQVRNDAAYPLAEDLDLGVEVILLSQRDMQAMFAVNQNGWDIFYQRYPDAPGIMTLSRVGFNASLDEALVYIGNQSHWLAGAGYYVLLRKANGAWTVDQQVMTWIS